MCILGDGYATRRGERGLRAGYGTGRPLRLRDAAPADAAPAGDGGCPAGQARRHSVGCAAGQAAGKYRLLCLLWSSCLVLYVLCMVTPTKG